MLNFIVSVNCRRIDSRLDVLRGLHRNPYFISIIVIVCVLQVLIIEYGGVVFKTVSLSGEYWAVSVLIGFVTLPIGMIIRLIPLPQHWCIPRSIREHERVVMTRERLQWISAVGQVQAQLSVFRALRGSRAIARQDPPARLPSRDPLPSGETPHHVQIHRMPSESGLEAGPRTGWAKLMERLERPGDAH